MKHQPYLKPWADLLSGTNALLTIALTGGVALHAINIYIVTTILPSVVNDIGGLEYYAWNTTLFVATSIVGSALSSKVLDSFGPKFSYLFALISLFFRVYLVCSFPINASVAGRQGITRTGWRYFICSELRINSHCLLKTYGPEPWVSFRVCGE